MFKPKVKENLNEVLARLKARGLGSPTPFPKMEGKVSDALML